MWYSCCGISLLGDHFVILEEYLEELEFLTYTAGGEVLKRFTQKMDTPNPKTFIGTGKMEELRLYIQEHKVGTAIFDDELSSAQERNISKLLNCKVLDRTNLILDIFAQRAQVCQFHPTQKRGRQKC